MSLHPFELEVGGARVAGLRNHGEGPRVLALHGWLDNAASFVPLAPHLSSLQLVAIDLPGHGHSAHLPAGASYTTPAAICHVLDVADALGWDRFSLLGHSMFRVSAGDAGQVGATEVLQGKVQVGNTHGQRLVRPGQATLSGSADAAPDAVSPLLPAPQLRSDELRLAPLPTLLAWAPVTGAAHYRVEVVQAATPEILLFAATTTDTRLAIGDLPPGQLRVLLRAVDAQGVEGLDASADFELSDQPPPPITVSPLHGQTVNSDRPRFRWSQAPGARSSVLQIASEPTFRQPLQEQATHGTDLRLAQSLPPGQYFWRVASRDGNGHQGRYGQALPLQLSNEPVDPALQPPEAAHGELTLRWQAGSEGQRYRVQVDRHGDFKAPLVDQTVAEPQVSFKRPWSGTLHVRVQYIDDDGHAGEFSPAQQIKLACRLCYGAGGGAVLLWLLL